MTYSMTEDALQSPMEIVDSELNLQIIGTQDQLYVVQSLLSGFHIKSALLAHTDDNRWTLAIAKWHANDVRKVFKWACPVLWQIQTAAEKAKL